jgi:hypothetical protein
LSLTRDHGLQSNQDLGSDQPSSGDAQINKALQQRRRLAVDAKKSRPRSRCQEVHAMLPAESDYGTSKP